MGRIRPVVQSSLDPDLAGMLDHEQRDTLAHPMLASLGGDGIRAGTTPAVTEIPSPLGHCPSTLALIRSSVGPRLVRKRSTAAGVGHTAGLRPTRDQRVHAGQSCRRGTTIYLDEFTQSFKAGIVPCDCTDHSTHLVSSRPR